MSGDHQLRTSLATGFVAVLLLSTFLTLRTADASTPEGGGSALAGCGCPEVGPYVEPAEIVEPFVAGDGSSAAASPRYRVTATGSLPSINLTVRRVSDNSVVMAITTAATDWGFSPDEDRFVTHRTNSGTLETQLYNLTAATPSVPVLQQATATSSARIGFSPGGKYFAFTWIWNTNSSTVGTIISSATTGAKVYELTYTFSAGGGADEFGAAGYGFSPDGDSFFIAWVTGPSTLQLNLVNLATGLSVYSPTMTGTGLWRFSPCGSMLAKVEQNNPAPGQMNTVLVRTSNGTSAGSRTDPVAPITFKTTAASHIATVAGTDHVLAANTDAAPCPDTQPPTWPGGVLSASNVGPTSLTLTWSAAADNVGVTSYRIYRGATLMDTVPGGQLSADVTGLAPSTTYTFTVQAGDAAANWSTNGPSIQKTTAGSIPTWPGGQTVVASKVRETTLTLTWGTAVDAEGVTGYKVLKNGVLLVDVGAGVHTHAVTGLVAGTTYTFTVQARDADANVSVDGPSTTATTTDFTELDVNEIRGQVYLDSNSNGVHDAGEPGVNTEVYPYIGFYAYRVNGTLMLQNQAGSGSVSGDYVVDGVADGQWLVSLIVWPRIQTGPADLAPQVVDVVAGHGAGEVDFGIKSGTFPPSTAEVSGQVWNDLDADGVRDAGENGVGGIGVGCYNVPLGASCDYPANAGATTAPDGSYSFDSTPPGTMTLSPSPPAGWHSTTPNRVVEVSSNGSAGGLDFGIAQEAGPVPGAPTVTSAQPGDELVVLGWTAPSGAAPVTDYVVQRSLVGGPWSTVPDGVSTSRSATVRGLTNGTAYRFRVAAHNAAGDGAWSLVVGATPRTVPGSPRSLDARWRRHKVKLTWDAPASTGGAVVTDYVIQVAKGSPKRWRKVADGDSTRTTFKVTGLDEGARYYFRVAAVNAAGRGSWSRPANVS